MKIFSLNCNKFGGSKEDNGRGEIFLKECMDNVILLAKTFLSLEEDNIIILQEVPYGREEAKKFKEQFEKEKYKIYMPTHIKKLKSISYGCTIAITRNNAKWHQIDSLIVSEQYDYANKNVILANDDYVIVGLHVTYDEKYWSAIIDYFKQHKNEKIILIGDFNVYEEGTDRKKKFDELLSAGAIDAWVALGNSPHKVTHRESRVDYVLMSQNAYTEVKQMSVIEVIREMNISDHSAIYVEL